MLYDSFRTKIITVDALALLIGEFGKRSRKVVLCHGVFDVAHSGHFSHLLYAKGQADLLVVSITADRFINKGVYRPHTPQDLRALHLAVLTMVDYVVIDDAASPIGLLNRLQPDIYAKGAEYETDVRPKHRAIEEVSVVRGYGGEVIFTPGDYVNSSSAIIKENAPDLRLDKLALVMQAERISWGDLYQTVDFMAGARVHVIGDLIVDSITRCSVIGGLTKTPTVSLLYEKRLDYVGGAGVIAKHFVAAGAEVLFTTVLGDDAFGQFALNDLTMAGVDVVFRGDGSRPTTNKNVFVDVASGYRMMKVDTVDSRSISDATLASIVDAIRQPYGIPGRAAVVMADFRHGIFNRRTVKQMIDAIPQGIMRVGDSQVASRWGNILDFPNFDLLTPNEREARFVLADQDSHIRALASALYDAANPKALVLKLGSHGVLLCKSADHEASDSYVVIDSFADRVVDPVGAGDAFLAYATLGQLHATPVIGTILGTMAAAVECELDGNIPVSSEDVFSRLKKTEEMMA